MKKCKNCRSENMLLDPVASKYLQPYGNKKQPEMGLTYDSAGTSQEILQTWIGGAEQLNGKKRIAPTRIDSTTVTNIQPVRQQLAGKQRQPKAVVCCRAVDSRQGRVDVYMLGLKI